MTRIIVCLAFLSLALTACQQAQNGSDSKPNRILGRVELRIDNQSDARANRPAAIVVSRASTRGLPDNSVVISRTANGTFDSTDGFRYMFGVFDVTNSTEQPFQNLTLHAFVEASQSLGQTAFKTLNNFGGTPITNTQIAHNVQPTHGMTMNGIEIQVDPNRADLQAVLSSESQAVENAARAGGTIQANDHVLQYAFVVRNKNGGRILAPHQTGTVTIAVKLPKVVDDQLNPTTMVFTAVLEDQSVTRVTRSPEETTAQAEARAISIGASEVALIGSDTDTVSPPRTTVRLLDLETAATPLCLLARTPNSISGLTVSTPQTSLLSGESVTISANVDGGIACNSGLHWEVVGEGTLSQTSGGTTVYTAPIVTSTRSAQVVAESTADFRHTVWNRIDIKPRPITVLALPSTIEISGGQSINLSATAIDAVNPNLIWQLVTGSGVLTPNDATGASAQFTAPDVSANTTMTVQVTSEQDPTKTALVTIGVKAKTSITGITLQAPSVIDGDDNVSISATLTGTGPFNSNAVFSSPIGTFNTNLAPNGQAVRWQAPDVASDQYVTITAVSQQDPSKTKSFAVFVRAQPQILELSAETFGGNANGVRVRSFVRHYDNRQLRCNFRDEQGLTWKEQDCDGGTVFEISSMYDPNKKFVLGSQYKMHVTVFVPGGANIERNLLFIPGAAQKTFGTNADWPPNTPRILSVRPSTFDNSTAVRFQLSVSVPPGYSSVVCRILDDSNGVQVGPSFPTTFGTTQDISFPRMGGFIVKVICEIPGGAGDFVKSAFVVGEDGGGTPRLRLTAPSPVKRNETYNYTYSVGIPAGVSVVGNCTLDVDSKNGAEYTNINPNGTTWSHTWSSVQPLGDYTSKLSCPLSDGRTASASTVVTLVDGAGSGGGTPSSNKAPIISSFTATPSSGTAPITVNLAWTVRDPDNDALTCILDANGDGIPDQTINNCTTGSFSQTFSSNGTYNAKLQVVDGRGGVANGTRVLGFGLTSGNHAPTVVLFDPYPRTTTAPRNVDLYVNTRFSVSVYDADSADQDSLRCEISTGVSNWSVPCAALQTRSFLYGYRVLRNGTDLSLPVSLTVTDQHGASVTTPNIYLNYYHNDSVTFQPVADAVECFATTITISAIKTVWAVPSAIVTLMEGLPEFWEYKNLTDINLSNSTEELSAATELIQEAVKAYNSGKPLEDQLRLGFLTKFAASKIGKGVANIFKYGGLAVETASAVPDFASCLARKGI